MEVEGLVLSFLKYRCGAGRIGNVRDYENSSARNDVVGTLSDHIQGGIL
jgi:hypothetical protein